jgi:hypothetical protein
MVVIVAPEFATEDFNMQKHVPDECFVGKESFQECPHLSWEGDKAICAIHEFSWYKDTPCFRHSQIESSEDMPCRMGEYLKKQNRNPRGLIGKTRKWL